MKKISRNFLINFAFAIFVFIICILYGQFCVRLPVLTESSVGIYKLLCGLKVFCLIVPAVFAASCHISWCIDFGLHPENSRLRFSDAMFQRYKGVIINGLVVVLVVTVAREICLPQIVTYMKNLEYKPVLMREYQNSATLNFAAENFETAYRYARLAYEIDPSDKTNKEVLYITEVYNDKKAEISKSFVQRINELTFDDADFGLSTPKIEALKEPFESFKLLQTARECFASNDYFGAHYHAQLAIKCAGLKDINVPEMKRIAAESWNKISQAKVIGTTEEQAVFAKKYEGYVSLINGDILRSYYIFHALSLQSKKLSIDPDVTRYLEISKSLLENQYFFRDETSDIQAYETAHNVYFRLKDDRTGRSTIYFIHGVTQTGSGSNMIQYLRGLEVIELDGAGNYRRGNFVPYAKMTCLQTQYLEQKAKEYMRLDPAVKEVPYILLNSVDKNMPNSMITPEYKGGYSKEGLEGYLVLNMPFSDFELIKQASAGADTMNLISLFYFVNKTELYGFSGEVFGEVMMNRMLRPLYVLILFVLIAWMAWHFRLEENSVFKFKWIVMFPLLSFTYILLCRLAICFFKFINYGLMGMVGQDLALFAGSIAYIVIFVIASLAFLSCRNSSGQ